MLVLWWCCGVVLGVASVPWAPGISVQGLVCLGAILSCLGVVCGGTLGRPTWAGRGAMGAAGVSVGLLLVATLPQGPVFRGPTAVRGVVVAASGASADISISQWARPGGTWTSGSGRVRVRLPDARVPVGVTLVARGEARAVSPSMLPGAPDPVRSASRARIRTTIWVNEFALVGARALGRRPRDPTGILRALAIGDRSGVSDDHWSLLRRTGTAHLLAISGFHVGIVALLSGVCARALCRLVALVRPVGVAAGWSWALGAATGVVYAVAAGSPISAQRAAWCIAGVAVARVLGRQVEPLTLLACAAVAIVVVDPSAVASPSMQLSFGAVVGILRVTPWILRWVPPDLPAPLPWAIQGVGLTLGATVGTLPAAAWWFQDLAPLSPLANLFAMPLMAFVVVPCATVSVWGPAFLEVFASTVGTGALELLFACLRPLAVEPLHPAVGPLGALVLIAPLVWPQRPLLTAPLVICALGLRFVPLEDRVTFLDVGQGDAALVELSTGQRMLVDGGPPSDRVLRWLRRRGIVRLDAVVVSHADADHLGGLLPVLRSLEVESLWVQDLDGLDEAIDIAEFRGIEVVQFADEGGETRNDRSLVVVFADTLLTGDIGVAAEGRLAKRLPPVSVLKVPHHGSRSSSSEVFLDALRPRIAVMGVGRHNRYGHPHPEVVDRYRRRDIALLRTDVHGTIEISVRGDRRVVRSFRAGRGWSSPRSFRSKQKDPEGDQGETD